MRPIDASGTHFTVPARLHRQRIILTHASLAQLVEQGILNPWVVGSNPT
jgi:hypothetical protein